MSQLALRGSMTALATPFNQGSIDEAAFKRLCQRQIERGTSALVVCGSTGEAAALSPAEQAALIRLAVASAAGQVPVIVGCGGPCTEAAAAVASVAATCGAAALLCAPTPYVKPSQQGIIAHMQALAHISDLPLILYDVPARAGVAISDATVATLFQRGLTIGIKDATANLARPPRLRALCGSNLAQLSGDDSTAAAYRAAGGDGCISVTANVAPSLCAAMHRSWDRADQRTFAVIRDRLAPLHDALFLETNPVPLKAALAMLNLATPEVRLPLIQATEPTTGQLADTLARIMGWEERHAHQHHALAS